MLKNNKLVSWSILCHTELRSLANSLILTELLSLSDAKYALHICNFELVIYFHMNYI
jgi:hypothetical protein